MAPNFGQRVLVFCRCGTQQRTELIMSGMSFVGINILFLGCFGGSLAVSTTTNDFGISPLLPEAVGRILIIIGIVLSVVAFVPAILLSVGAYYKNTRLLKFCFVSLVLEIVISLILALTVQMFRWIQWTVFAAISFSVVYTMYDIFDFIQNIKEERRNGLPEPSVQASSAGIQDDKSQMPSSENVVQPLPIGSEQA